MRLLFVILSVLCLSAQNERKEIFVCSGSLPEFVENKYDSPDYKKAKQYCETQYLKERLEFLVKRRDELLFQVYKAKINENKKSVAGEYACGIPFDPIWKIRPSGRGAKTQMIIAIERCFTDGKKRFVVIPSLQ